MGHASTKECSLHSDQSVSSVGSVGPVARIALVQATDPLLEDGELVEVDPLGDQLVVRVWERRQRGVPVLRYLVVKAVEDELRGTSTILRSPPIRLTG